MKTPKGKKGKTLRRVPTVVEVIPQTKVDVVAPGKIAGLKKEFDAEAAAIKPVRKYSKRQTREDEEKAAKIESLKSDFNAFGGMLLDVMCPRMPNPIPPTEQEKELFGNAVGRIIEKYAPQLGGYDAELALAVAVLVVFAPRMKRTTNPKREKTGHIDTGEAGKREEPPSEKTDTKVS